MPRQKARPKYMRHAATGQARTRIDGKDMYLGVYDSQASRDRFQELLNCWLLRQNSTAVDISIDELALRFLAWADDYYRTPDLQPTGTATNMRQALRFVIELFGVSRAAEFGPLRLMKVRDAMISAGLCRTNINRLVHQIRRMFSWGVQFELIRAEQYQSLKAVDPLKLGRTKAVESRRVLPVSLDQVEATLPHLPPVVASMVRLQLLSGARPTEVCILRPCDITLGDGVWIYRPYHHKTTHKDRERRIHFGPEAQVILRPLLDATRPEEFVFRPQSSEQDRFQKLRAERISRDGRGSNKPSVHARSRPHGVRYSKDSYGRAVRRACEFAFEMPAELRRIPKAVLLDSKCVPVSVAERERLGAAAAQWRTAHCWSPNQLRHLRATELRQRFGIEAAQVVLGHSDPKVTLVYAERDFEAAAKIMKAIG